MATPTTSPWPILRSYRGAAQRCIAMPLGGIGTGTVALGGRGELRDWELHNHPGKGALPATSPLRDYGANALFLLYCRAGNAPAVMRALEGTLPPPYEGAHGATPGFHGVPRFRQSSFHAAYPLAQVRLQDPDVPLRVRLEAFNPLVPGDADASGIPIAVLRYVLTNPTEATVTATVCGSLGNLAAGEKRVNAFRTGAGVNGLFLTATGGEPLSREAGSMALVTTATDVSYRSQWPEESWRRPLLHFWDDLLADGRLDELPPTATGGLACASLAASVHLEPGATVAVTFALTWHFPNRYNWAPAQEDCGCGKTRLKAEDRIGNYYTTRYRDAWEVATQALPDLGQLEADTVAFVRAFCASSLPTAAKEAALFNLSTLRTETCFRTPDGNLYGWEGCSDSAGCCSGSCTHVWNYETATPFLFGDLAQRMRTVEFQHATHPETGAMSFRVQLPLEREKGEGKAAADGQMGCIMKVCREWRLSGDTPWLRGLWPRIRKAVEFCWLPGGWDADADGVMEGCQHNTMDVEYFGPNPQMQAWYLGALRAAEEMAAALGEAAFAQHCRRLFQQGSQWTDAHLFNGEYYEQQIRPPADAAAIQPQTRLHMGAADLAHPDLQLGPGCLVDQLVGQYMAHVCGLGYLLAEANVKATLAAIRRYNSRASLYGHFNNMRTYALNDEAALLMASYPRGGRPESPFPYFNEVMTGFEYCAGVHLLFEGDSAAGLQIIRDIRARYDGVRRNPFDEAECGHHYARAMAAWSAVLAIPGFQYNAVAGSLRFAARPGRWFWSTGHSWGLCRIAATAGQWRVTLEAVRGDLRIERFCLGAVELGAWPGGLLVSPGRRLTMAAANPENAEAQPGRRTRAPAKRRSHPGANV